MAFPRKLQGLDFADVRAALDALDGRCAALMRQERVEGGTTIQYLADMLYVGQSYHLDVRLRPDDPDPLQRLYRDFLAAHDRVYGHATESPAAIVNLRAVHRAGGSAMLDEGTYQPDAGDPLKGHRRIRVAGIAAPVQAAIYHRVSMPVGLTFVGPAIVEQDDTTTLVEPCWHCAVLSDGALLLTHQGDL